MRAASYVEFSRWRILLTLYSLLKEVAAEGVPPRVNFVALEVLMAFWRLCIWVSNLWRLRIFCEFLAFSFSGLLFSLILAHISFSQCMLHILNFLSFQRHTTNSLFLSFLVHYCCFNTYKPNYVLYVYSCFSSTPLLESGEGYVALVYTALPISPHLSSFPTVMCLHSDLL